MGLVKTRTQRNVLANFLGQGATALVAFVFAPLYLHFLGIEAFGLVGFYLTLQAAFVPVDQSLSLALNRGLASLSAEEGRAAEMRELTRTLEVVYWAAALMLGAAVLLLAPVLASYWVRPEALGSETVSQAIRMMGLVLALHWPLGFYAGGLSGLQHQALLNGLNAGMALVRSGGAVLVLWLVSPTIQAYFTWQVGVSGLHTCWRSCACGAACRRSPGGPASGAGCSAASGGSRPAWAGSPSWICS
jgi:O-antigen/teichoic acid export membrane protein